MTEDLEALLARAVRGDEPAWRELVVRFTPLVRSVISRYGLNRADTADVNQTLWLRLVEHLGLIREPAALPKWIIRTTSHECLRVLRSGRRTQSMDVDALIDDRGLDERLLRAERQRALREGLSQLPERCRRLLTLLVHDPPASYQEISRQLAIPLGSVGPTRARCLDKLRSSPAVAEFLNTPKGPDRVGAEATPGGPLRYEHRQPGEPGGEGHDIAADVSAVEQR